MGPVPETQSVPWPVRRTASEGLLGTGNFWLESGKEAPFSCDLALLGENSLEGSGIPSCSAS